MNKTLSYIQGLLEDVGISERYIQVMTSLTSVLLSLLLMYIVYYVLNRYMQKFIYKLTYHTTLKWDDVVFRPKAMRWAWLTIPLIIGDITLPQALAPYPGWRNAITIMLTVALILSVMMLLIEGVKSIFLLIGDRENIDSIVESMHEANANGEEFVYKPSHSLKGLQQMITIIIVGFAMILCVSVLFGKDPLIVISGLGAAAAIIMLVFQDSILGVVAGVQITANDLLQPGDWIMAPKYQANGIVTDVTLAAVKVQNWDKTIVTIPPYHLLTEGFQNWRGMQQSRGRRIMRSINIDISTIRYATDDEVNAWCTQKWWHKKSDKDRMVNVTAFRMYLEHYITTVPTMRHNMLYMIRELQPTAEGLPIEIYFFTSKTEWKSYEAVQADVFDQILASVSDFGLRVYQRPSSYDFRG